MTHHISTTRLQFRLFLPFVVSKKRAYTGAQHYKKFGRNGRDFSFYPVLGEAYNRDSHWVRGE